MTAFISTKANTPAGRAVVDVPSNVPVPSLYPRHASINPPELKAIDTWIVPPDRTTRKLSGVPDDPVVHLKATP
jgi:hypothetical protein